VHDDEEANCPSTHVAANDNADVNVAVIRRATDLERNEERFHDRKHRRQAFIAYFESTWVSEDFIPQLWWIHYDHMDPRTISLEKGFHNSLNSRFGINSSCLRTFLDWLHK